MRLILLLSLFISSTGFSLHYKLKHGSKITFKTQAEVVENGKKVIHESSVAFIVRELNSDWVRLYWLSVDANGDFTHAAPVYVDINSQGVAPWNASRQESHRYLGRYFPELPKSTKTPWTNYSRVLMSTWEYDVSKWYVKFTDLKAQANSLMLKLSNMDVRREQRFDRWRGLMDQTVETFKTPSTVFTITIDTPKVEHIRPDRLKFLAQHLENYFRLQPSISVQLELARKDARDWEKHIKTAEDLIAQGKKVAKGTFAEGFYGDLEASLKSTKENATKLHPYFKNLGKPAPAWQAVSFTGNSLASQDLSNKVIIYDFWFSTCPYCVKLLPEIKALARDYKNSLEVAFIGFNADKTLEKGIEFAQLAGMDYPNFHDRSIPGDFGVKGFPTLMVVDKRGIIREIELGAGVNMYERLRDLVERLRREP